MINKGPYSASGHVTDHDGKGSRLLWLVSRTVPSAVVVRPMD